MDSSWSVVTFFILYQTLLSNIISVEALTSSGGSSSDDSNDSSGSNDDSLDYGLKNEQNPMHKKDLQLPHHPESKELLAEMNAGEPSDLFGTNQHYIYPANFNDLGRRFVLQYPYKEIKKDQPQKTSNKNKEIIPVLAKPEEVLAVALHSAIDEASVPKKASRDVDEKDILRTGNYWNSVWVEEVDPKTILRSSVKQSNVFQDKTRSKLPELGSVHAKIMPGSKLYELVSVLKKYSPRLLYVINHRRSNDDKRF